MVSRATFITAGWERTLMAMNDPPCLLWYGGYPVGFHNPESERKASAFAARGYAVVYSTGVGLRDPRIRSAAKIIRIASERLTSRRADGDSGPAPPFTSAAFVVIPPRRAPAVRRFNARLIAGQLRRAVPALPVGVAWVRYPSPELVDALAVVRPRVTVYECLDAMDQTPGTTGAWRTQFLGAERDLATLADAIVVPSDGLGARFEEWSAKLHVVPHGVDPSPWRPPPGDGVAGFVGTLDYRLDVDVIEGVAALPGWRVRLVGPVSEGFDEKRVRRMSGVSIESAVPHEHVPDVLAGFDVGLMPYVDGPMFRGMTPIKNIELLAVGRPAVARRSPALEPFSDLVAFAGTPEQFASSVVRMAAEDSEKLARRRQAMADGYTWKAQVDRLIELVDALLQQPR